MRKCTAEKLLQLFRALRNAAISKESAKMQFFSRTVFANEKTHLGPTLNTCKVGAWQAALKNFHSLLFSVQRLVHVCWCTLGVL